MRKSRVEIGQMPIGRGPTSVGPRSRLCAAGFRLAMASLILLDGRLVFGAQTPSPAPSPTPTARARLTGGFGRPAATPVVTQEAGQSLSDVVKAASESKTRKEQKPRVAITNESLVTDSRKGNLTVAGDKNLPPQPTPTQSPSAQSSSPTVTPSPGAPMEGEAEWIQRAKSARERVEEARARVYQLEGETASLEKDFYRWDDGQYRDGVIKPAWDKKKEELEAARKELEEAQRDLAELPEKARKAGALPGWIRE